MFEYLAEIRWFAGNFAPRGWFLCQGQLLPIAQYDALFALVGTLYGGDGQVTFALPDFRGRVPVGVGDGPGLSPVVLGEVSGTNNVTLLSSNLPAHTHTASVVASSGQGTSTSAAGNWLAGSNDAMYSATANLSAMQPGVPTSSSGNNAPVSVMQPYLGMNFILCADGLFPSRG